MSESLAALDANAESQEWWRLWREQRDPRARERLITHYLPFARSVAARLYGRRRDQSVGFDDYLQYARLGMLEALSRFEPERGVSFTSFAARRVRGAILNGLGKESELAAHRQYRIEQWRDRQASLRELTPATQRKGLQALSELVVHLAIGAMLEAEEDLPDDREGSNPYAQTELAVWRQRLGHAMLALPERERWIIEQHYLEGIDFQDLAAGLQLSKGRVSQLHARAIALMRATVQKLTSLTGRW